MGINHSNNENNVDVFLDQNYYKNEANVGVENLNEPCEEIENLLDLNKQNFEKKIKFLILINRINLFPFFGGVKKHHIDKLTRNDVKKYLESLNCLSSMEWINVNLPGKIIKRLKKPQIFTSELNKKFKTDPDYIQEMRKIYTEFIRSEIQDDLIEDLAQTILLRKYIVENDYLTTYEKFFPENLNTELKIQNFFDSYITYEYETFIEKNMSIYKYIFTRSNIYSNKFITAKKITSEYEGIKISSRLSQDLVKIMTLEQKKIFVADFIKNINTETIDKMFMVERNLISSLNENIYFSQKINNIKLKLYKEKYFCELSQEKQDEETHYSLNIDSHYEFYKNNQQEYVKLISLDVLIDDYTFEDYNINDYSFLNVFNNDVKECLKKKITADTNREIKWDKKYNPINSLDDLIDIVFFINDPPNFLRSNDSKYFFEYSNLMLMYAKDFAWDDKKLEYKHFILKLIQLDPKDYKEEYEEYEDSDKDNEDNEDNKKNNEDNEEKIDNKI